MTALLLISTAAVAQAQTPVFINTGFAVPADNQLHNPFTDDGKVAVTVREDQQGGTDLNGDGDTTDRVLFIFDPATNTAVNANATGGVAGHVNYPIGGGLVVSHDVQVNPRKLYVYDIAAGTNTLITGSLNAWAPYDLPSLSGRFGFFSNTPSPVKNYGWNPAYPTSAEGVPGLADLGNRNGGGESSMRLFGEGGIAQTAAGGGLRTVDPTYGVRTHAIGSIHPSLIGPSLPGPGGFSIICVNTAGEAKVVAPDGTITTLPGTYQTNFHRITPLGTGEILLQKSGSDREYTIWNGDVTSPSFRSLPRPSYSNYPDGGLTTATSFNAGGVLQSLANGGIVTSGDERNYLSDLDGDGVVATHPNSRVYQIFDPVSNEWYSVGHRPFPFGGTRRVELASGEFLFPAQERRDDPSQSVDLNGNGLTNDIVVVSWNQATHTLTSTGIACRNLGGGQTDADAWNNAIHFDDFELPDHAFLLVFEGDPTTSPGHGANADLNGDGDQLDLVIHSYNEADGLHNHGLAMLPNGSGDVQFIQLFYRGRQHGVTATISEVSSGGVDLNGDGDALDHAVFHVVMPYTPPPPPPPIPTIGGYFCDQSTPNSSAMDATIAATGSTEVALNDFTLTVRGLPLSGTTALLFNSMSANHPPIVPVSGGVASSGHLCIASFQMGRHGQDIYIGNAGWFSATLDLMNVPYPVGPNDYSTAVMAGQSWFWQCWYRDGMGGASNLTNAVRVTFE